jgi:hypothetical protein
MWKIPVSSRLHIILWFLANNKIFTRKNLPKRRKVENMSCLFCNKKETSQVICFFFIVVLPRFFGKNIAEICGRALGADFESLAKLCLNDNKT